MGAIEYRLAAPRRGARVGAGLPFGARPNARNAFTLVELLVVMAIVAALGALMVAFLPNAASAQREARAATLLQSWLNIAKQRALRDQAPRGLRLWYATNYLAGSTPLANVVTDCQYIEQPSDFPSTSGMTASLGPALYANCSTIGFTSGGLPADLTNGYGAVLPAVQPGPNSDPNAKYWFVQPGDYLEILGNGLIHQVIQVGVLIGGTVASNYVVVSPPLPNGLPAGTTNWRIIRAPRVVGDETLKLPVSTLIDLGTNVTYASALPPTNSIDNGTTAYVDILFAPTGAVISPGVANSNINLWVRSPALDSPTNVFRGDPTIVSVFVGSGFVGAYSPDPNLTSGNPYTFVK